MTDEETGLPADNIEGDLDPASSSAYTSPTNIGGWLWSTVVARDLGLLDEAEARDRLATTIDTVASLDRHDASGMFYNWYDPRRATGWRRGPTTATRCTSSSARWTTAGWPRACASSRRRSRASRTRRWPSTTACTSARSTTRRRGRTSASGCCAAGSGTRSRPGARSPATTSARARTCTTRATTTTRRSRRRASRPTSASPRARCRRRPTARATARSRTRATGRGRSRSRSARRASTWASRSSRGVPLPRPRGRAGLGRLDVRGAHAGHARPRGRVGPDVVGRQPPARRPGAQGARSRRGRLRGLGLLAREQPLRRLRGVRRRRDRPALRRLPVRRRDRRRPRLRGLPRGHEPRAGVR